MSDGPGALDPAEAQRLIGQISRGDRNAVLIGGQAIAFWQRQLASRLGPADAEPIASEDVDFQGTPASLDRAAQALGGSSRHTPPGSGDVRHGYVEFTDQHGQNRQIDFLPQPLGVEREKAHYRAGYVSIDGTTARVLHPLDCLQSRAANSTLVSKNTPQAWAQFAAAVRIVPAYNQQLLDTAERSGDPAKRKRAIKQVTKTNNTVIKLAAGPSGQRAHEHGIQIADAALDDPRLPAEHRAQLQEHLRQLANAHQNTSPGDSQTTARASGAHAAGLDSPSQRPPTPAPAASRHTGAQTPAGRTHGPIWVRAHTRNGKPIKGHWRQPRQ